ncbi:MAG: glycosyltransferase family 4 protein [Novosphingobium sp.]|uniref:glycosyltransferase family 4 protein n=1 Tax=Novosphingobium sp. TaxID=1874826 RepID=UPI0030167851
MRIVFIGNALPRRCGIATFTTDLELAMRHQDDVSDTAIVAMCDPGGPCDYAPPVRRGVPQEDAGAYLTAAEYINEAGYDVVSLQHEFGIFGGEAGNYLLGLIAALRIPLVTTLHTVLDQPSEAQRAVMMAILAASARVVVMARKARAILIDTYGADPVRIVVIPHGIPDLPLVNALDAKRKLGFAGHRVILTFGLISPNKGIEVMIEAMPAVLAAAPDAVYVVMGATHPALLRAEGEAYRESLIARAHELGLDGHVVFLNRFAERPELLEHIAMCDVYVTPYLVEAQMTSGTLAYSHGLGRPVVSTPYWHAAELLADGSGVLVPFNDPAALGGAVADLLTDETARLAMGRGAYRSSRPTTWTNTALRYHVAFRAACRRPGPAMPALPLTHLAAMCDDTGLFQHAVGGIPDRNHGYCIDDNARALLVCSGLGSVRLAGAPAIQPLRFAAFIQHGWNPDRGRFRNFMSFDRRWLEELGSEDSHGRTLWALGTYASEGADQDLALWAADLFARALEAVEGFTSPRAWAFTLLGLHGYSARRPHDRKARHIGLVLAERLTGLLQACRSEDWVWFESRLTYDNARLCEALITTGRDCAARDLVDAGLAALRWLIARQTAPGGHFRPVGSDGFLLAAREPQHFDQQPLEACATIAACLAASTVDPGPFWQDEAVRAFAWFGGANDLGVALVDPATGSCRDGLHRDRANENRGAESVLSYLLGLADMHRFEKRSTGPFIEAPVTAAAPVWPNAVGADYQT